MTLIDLQRRIAEVGRIRIGQQTATGNGRTRPTKLDTFRLTSPDRNRIEAAAGLYGGTVEKWDAPSGKQWQVVTTTDTLPVIVPPTEVAFSQFYEQWTAGGCTKRCDGAWEQIADQACSCNPESRACVPHTRLSVMLRDVPGLGVWRLDTSGYYAAVELQGAVEIIALAARAGGTLLPASLRLEQRTVKRTGEARRDFAVPVLDIDITPAQLLAGGVGHQLAPPAPVAALPAPAPLPPATGVETLPSGVGALNVPLLTPVPDTVPQRPVGSLRDQIAKVADIERVRRGSVPVTGTGLEPTPITSSSSPTSTPSEDTDDPWDDQWAELAGLLANPPSDKDTMTVVEERLRHLFHVMDAVGLWGAAADGTDALHKALQKHYGVEHVGDLRKTNLVAFASRSWTAAQAAWETAR